MNDKFQLPTRRAASRSSGKLVGSPEALAANKSGWPRRRPPPTPRRIERRRHFRSTEPVSGGVTIPETLAELLTPAGSTPVLATRFPGWKSPPSSRGRSSSGCRRMRGSRSRASPRSPPGSRPPLCAKGYFSEAGRVSSAGGCARGQLLPGPRRRDRVRTLNSVWAGIDPATSHGVVITEDVVEAGGVFRGASTSARSNEIADHLAELAHLHAYGWEHPEIVERRRGSSPASARRRTCAGSRRSGTTSTGATATACPTTCEIRSSSSTRSTHSAPTTRCGVDRHPR